MKRNSNSLRAAGNAAEEYACGRLTADGYSILCRNYTCTGGEIDIIAAKGQYICFIEVKSRSVLSESVASEAVDSKKEERMRLSARHFFEEYRENLYASSLSPRFDVIEIYTDKNSVKIYNHLTGII